MKSALRISVAANLVLLAVALGLARRVRVEKDSALRDAAATASAREPEPPPQRSSPEPKSFHWSQLESTDYPTYIANLRSIGCPEQTLRDIIVAEVHLLYAPRGQEWERKRSAFASNPTATHLNGGQVVAAALQKLRDEETALVSALLGPRGSGPDADFTASDRVSRNRALDRIVAMPLAFQNVDLTAMTLDDRQAEVIGELRQKFQQDLGGPDQDPNDPAYRKRWQAAQRESDDLLSGMLGGQFFLDYQMQAASPLQ